MCISSVRSFRSEGKRKKRHGHNGDVTHGEPCKTLETTELVRLEALSNHTAGESESKTSCARFENAAPPGGAATFALEQQVADIRRCIQRIESKMEDKAQRERAANMIMREWKACALVLDRLFFVLYLVLIVVSLVVLFPRPKESEFPDFH